MANQISINLFNGFSIKKDGVPILENLSNTRKTKLFVAYLLTNRDRAISHQELFELLWSGEEYANPATALRTLLYRFRSMIDKEGADALSGAIISRRGTYQWNKNLDISIDALDFCMFADKGLDKNLDLNTRRETLENAINLYVGSLLPDFCSEPWLISKSASYRDKYIDVVINYIEILKTEKNYAQILSICEKAEELAGTSELLQLEKQMARIYASNAIPNEGTVSAYYNQVKELSLYLQDEVDSMQQELEDDTVEQMAYLCDYKTFKEIYRLQRRMQSRSKATIFLGLMDVKSDDTLPLDDDFFSHDNIMTNVTECCQRQLRCGDAICKKNDSEIAILFPAESYEDAMGVLERLKNASRERIGEDLVIVYKVRPLKNAHE